MVRQTRSEKTANVRKLLEDIIHQNKEVKQERPRKQVIHYRREEKKIPRMMWEDDSCSRFKKPISAD